MVCNAILITKVVFSVVYLSLSRYLLPSITPILLFSHRLTKVNHPSNTVTTYSFPLIRILTLHTLLIPLHRYNIPFSLSPFFTWLALHLYCVTNSPVNVLVPMCSGTNGDKEYMGGAKIDKGTMRGNLRGRVSKNEWKKHTDIIKYIFLNI